MADVYCFGHVSTGVVLRLHGAYPPADGYAEVVETLENHAGEATGTALVLHQFGVSVALEGNWIGDTPACRRTLEFLRQRGLDCSGLRVVPGYAGATEIVISDAHSRTVFGRYVDLLFTTKQWDDPDPRQIAAAKVVALDSTFGATTLAVSRQAAAAGIPVATYDARHDSELAAAAAALVISREYLRREYPAAAADEGERAALFARYQERCPGLVVFTAGAGPLWWGRAGGTAAAARHELPAFPVQVVDSAGAGDSFRAGLIYAMLQGWSDAEGVRFAAAVAALVCTRAPGCVNPPSLADVHQLLADGGPRPVR
jgi:sugar/nucleoside kinase (ribokinase family)